MADGVETPPSLVFRWHLRRDVRRGPACARYRHRRPGRTDQQKRRKGKGSAGGRPPAFDPKSYAERNTVERGFGRLKQWRGIATRYDKYALTYLSGVLLATALLHTRSKQLRDTL